MHKANDSKDIGLLVRQERKAQGLTQAELAALTGVGTRFVRELEAGKETCQIGRVLLVLGGLGLAVSVASRQEGAS